MENVETGNKITQLEMGVTFENKKTDISIYGGVSWFRGIREEETPYWP